MAIEVRELIIKATIVSEGTAGHASSQSESQGGNVSPNEEMINTCVEKILEIIKDKNVR